MKRIVFLSIFLLLYSCSDFNTDTKNYRILKKRIDRLETDVQKNRVNIQSNIERINNLDSDLLLIHKRIEAERENFINKIPPASDILDNSTQHNQTVHEEKINTEKSKKTQSINNVDNISISKGIKSTTDKSKTDFDYKSFYKKALNTYMNGNYTKSKEMFKTFIDRYTNNSLYDNALFWLACSHIHLGYEQKAADILKKLIKQYPDSPVKIGGKTDAALFELIKIYKNDKRLKDYYKNILKRKFPDSRYVKIIKKY